MDVGLKRSRLPWLKGLGLVMLAMVASVASALETVEMTLRWNFLKLGTVTFEQEFKDNQQRFEIIGKTAGPLRLVKNYDGRGLLLSKGQVDDYTLEGTDGGVDEIRRIVFEAGKLPKVLSFIDRTAATHMEPREPWGLSAVSPMALMYRVIRSANQRKLCEGHHTVYDGKRHYKVVLSITNALSNMPAPSSTKSWFVCTAVLEGETIKSVETVPAEADSAVESDDVQANMRQVWLFGRSDRRMDFTLKPDCGTGVLREVAIYAPLGKIVGKVAEECGEPAISD